MHKIKANGATIYAPDSVKDFHRLTDMVLSGKVLPDMVDFHSAEADTEHKIKLRFKGGSGSGFHGHAGRPGEVGGSAPDDGIKQFSWDTATADLKDIVKKYGKLKDNIRYIRKWRSVAFSGWAIEIIKNENTDSIVADFDKYFQTSRLDKRDVHDDYIDDNILIYDRTFSERRIII